jgi:hypothetical protein
MFLRIAAGNVPNLVDPATGEWGKVLLDRINSTQTTTLATLNTLGSLVAACATTADDAWRDRFFKAATPTGGATPKNSLEAVAGIAREPWAAPEELYALFRIGLERQSLGSEQRFSGFPSSKGPGRCVYHGAISHHGWSRYEISETHWRDHNDPPRRDPTRADGLYRRRHD